MYAIPILSLYQCTLLPICTVATVQLLYAIPILTVTIPVHTVTNMYGSHSTVTLCGSNSPSQYFLIVGVNIIFYARSEICENRLLASSYLSVTTRLPLDVMQFHIFMFVKIR